jgi:hypothetical protein
MSIQWANYEEIGSTPVFEALHSGLTVKLIATPRKILMTCADDDEVSSVLERNTELYDYIPVIVTAPDGKADIVGLLHAARYFGAPTPEGHVRDHRDALSEEVLIGADASILDFIRTADERPCRLAVSGAGIVGLVSLSDLQKLPVRAALFALVTGLEITMSEAIRRHFQHEDGWLTYLNEGRRQKIKIEIAKARTDDGFVDNLLFTQFCDKADIIAKSFALLSDKTAFRTHLKEIQDLRDNLAHANEYAASPEQARRTCAIVRTLLDLREQIALHGSELVAGAVKR